MEVILSWKNHGVTWGERVRRDAEHKLMHSKLSRLVGHHQKHGDKEMEGNGEKTTDPILAALKKGKVTYSWCDHDIDLEYNTRGQRIFSQEWIPKIQRHMWGLLPKRNKECKGAVFVVHGLNSHSGRYETLVREFVGHGYWVFSHDLHGHGRSFGVNAFTSSIQHYVDDARFHVNSVMTKHKALQNKPMFLVGHSMGGAVAIRLARDDETLLTKAARPKFDWGRKVLGRWWQRKQQPDIEKGSMGEHSTGTNGWISTSVPLLNSSTPHHWTGVLLTSPAVSVFPKPLLKILAPIVGTLLPLVPVQKLKSRSNFSPDTVNDPLILHMGVRARVGYEMLKSCNDIMRTAKRFTSNLFVAHAINDRVTAAKGSELFVNRASSRIKTLRLYDSKVHDLLGNAEYAPQVAKDMVIWANERVETGKKDKL